tara:strand:- start:365 stop:883 length:519 start_codon:yes stop_codon:yes gene_type:complete
MKLVDSNWIKTLNYKKIISDRLIVRKYSRKSGLIWFVAGVLVLINSPFMFPIPIVGLPSVMLALILSLVGIRKIYNGLKLPLLECLLVMGHAGGEINLQELIEALGGSKEVSAEELLLALDKKDWARRACHHLPYVESQELSGNEINSNLIILLDRGRQQLSEHELSAKKEF